MSALSLAGWGALAGALFLAAAFVWLRRALAAEHARGMAAGRAAAAEESRAQENARRAAAQAALSQTEHDVAALETRRDELQEKLDDLDRLATRDGLGGAVLPPDLVRALDAIRPNGQHAGPDAPARP